MDHPLHHQLNHPLHHLYNQIPHVPCSGQCGRNRSKTCCGPIGCTTVEAKILELFDGTTCAWVALPDGQVMMDPTSLPDMRCPHLGISGRCEAYDVRPLICRLWGAVERMRCPWGCKPDHWLSDDEARRLLREAVSLTTSLSTKKPAPGKEHSGTPRGGR